MQFLEKLSLVNLEKWFERQISLNGAALLRVI